MAARRQRQDAFDCLSYLAGPRTQKRPSSTCYTSKSSRLTSSRQQRPTSSDSDESDAGTSGDLEKGTALTSGDSDAVASSDSDALAGDDSGEAASSSLDAGAVASYGADLAALRLGGGPKLGCAETRQLSDWDSMAGRAPQTQMLEQAATLMLGLAVTW